AEDVTGLIADMRRGIYYVEEDGRIVEQRRLVEREDGRTEPKPYSAYTIRGVLTLLTGMLNTAVMRGHIAQSPMLRLERSERPVVEDREMRILEKTEIDALLAAAKEEHLPLLSTAIFTGVRLSELLGLVWADVDLDAGVIRVRQQLGREGQRVAPKTA